jgi:chromosome segregation ATPase
MSLVEKLNKFQIDLNQSNEQLEQKIKMFDADTAKKEGEWRTANEKLTERRVDIAKEEERLKVEEAELSERQLDCLQWEKELKAASIKTAVGIVAKTVVGEAGDFKARLDALFEFRM